MSDRIDIQNVLNQMRTMKLESQQTSNLVNQDRVAGLRVEGSQEVPSFSSMMTDALDSVNQLQQESGRLSNALERGDESVTLTQTMIASQKAGVAFQAVTEVRNKLVEAYEKIMNMPI